MIDSSPLSVVELDDRHLAGRLSVLRGRARCATRIRHVEVSVDGGICWDEASITGPNHEGDWVDWEHPWTPLVAEAFEVLVRVTETDGTAHLSEPTQIVVG